MKIDKRFIVFIFCFIGCSTHLTFVIINFLEFDVRTEVEYTFPTKLYIPEIDFAIPLLSIINTSELFLRHPKETRKLCRQVLRRPNLPLASVKDYLKHCSRLRQSVTVSDSLSTMLTVGDIEKLAFDPKSFFHSITTPNSEINLLNSNLCTINRYFSGYAYFFRISCRNNSKPIIAMTTLSSLGNNVLACIFHNMNFSHGFRFTEPYRTIESRLSQYYPVIPNEDKYTIINSRFSKFIIKSLPSPYLSKCREYNQSVAFHQCIDEELVLGKNPAIYVDRIRDFGRYPKNATFISYNINAEDKYLKSSMRKCYEATKQSECIYILYKTTAVTYHDYYSADGNTICIEPPIDHDVQIDTYPDQTFSEFLVYVSSILGIWFGVSVYGRLTAQFLSSKNYSQQVPLSTNTDTIFKQLKINPVSSNKIRVSRLKQIHVQRFR